MPYDLHIVRTRNWLEASSRPVTKQEVDGLVAGDPELEWSTSDYIDMSDNAGAVTRYYMIAWRGHPLCWWYRDQIQCSGPDEAQQVKLAQMARTLNAFVVGDDGEIYNEEGPPTQPPVSLGERLAGWFERWRPQRRPGIEPPSLPFRVGDRVRDPWGHEHTVTSIDALAEHGMGVIRTRCHDGTEHAHALISHGLERVQDE